MIGKPLLRVFAIALSLGQLSQLPAGVACATMHARPAAASHCGSMPLTGGPALTGSHDGGMPSCAGVMACVAQAPALAAARPAAAPAGALAAVAPAAAPEPTSLLASPPSPPPQA